MNSVDVSNPPRSRNLVFASVGDRSNVHRWLQGRRDFDLWIAYYGDTPGQFEELADIYVNVKGSKFQNLLFCFRTWREQFAGYEAVLVLDDDIEIDASGITRLFMIRHELDLWLLQPAFRPVGKISWDITRVRPRARLRYTNFVEMSCPLFRIDKLAAFMAVFTGELAGYGEDWWFLSVLGTELENHVAIIDEVTCVNPFDRTKGGGREIDRLRTHEERLKIWNRVKDRYNLTEQGRAFIEYRRINKPPLAAAGSLVRFSIDWTYSSARNFAWRWLRGSRRPRRRAGEREIPKV